MSKKNNVNPGQYKVAGRERTDDLAKERMKATRAERSQKKRLTRSDQPPRGKR